MHDALLVSIRGFGNSVARAASVLRYQAGGSRQGSPGYLRAEESEVLAPAELDHAVPASTGHAALRVLHLIRRSALDEEGVVQDLLIA